MPASVSNTHRQWDNVASAAQLPNVSGATIQSSKVRVGDLCYVVAGPGTYRCDTATLGAAVWTELAAGSSSDVLWEWNGTDVSQFDPTPLVLAGTPVNPTLTFTNLALPAITPKFDVGTTSGTSLVWWIDGVSVPWSQIREINFVLSQNQAVPITDVYALGVVAAGDRGLNTFLTFIGTPTEIGVLCSNGSSPGVTITNETATNSSMQFIRFIFNSNTLGGTGTFSPNGVPQYVGSCESAGLSPAFVKQSIFSTPVINFSGPDWGPAIPESLGIYFAAPAGVVDPAGLSWLITSIVIKR